MRVLEGKLTRITYRVSTICIDQIADIMHGLVVGIPPTWIRLMHGVARAILVYIEAIAAEEAEEASDLGDQGGQD